MSDRDRTAVGVDGLRVQGQLAKDGEALPGERLVQLRRVDGRDVPASARRGEVRGLDGTDAHDRGVDTDEAARHDPGDRREPVALACRLRGDDDRGRPVVQRRGVARGDRPALAEHRAQPPERLHRRVGPGALVASERPGLLAAGRHLDGQDLRSEAPVLPGGDGALVGAQRERVLLLTGDVVLLDEVLRRLPHRDRRVELGEVGVDEPPPEARVHELRHAPRRQRLRLCHDPRRPGHRLHAPGHDDVGLVDLDRPPGLHDGIQAGRAQAVHRGARHGDRQSGEQQAHPGDVAVVLAGLVRAAGDDLVDGARFDPAAPHGLGDGLGEQVVGPDAAQRTPELAHGCAHALYKERLCHVTSSFDCCSHAC
jgi:hypothetical protein